MYKYVNKRIREARLEKKITQKQLAEELTNLGRKTSNTAIANWESGLNSPDIDTLELICQILEKDANYFFDKVAEHNIIETDDLTNTEIEELKKYKEFLKSKRKNK